MNTKQRTIGAALSLATAAGVLTGALIHNATGEPTTQSPPAASTGSGRPSTPATPKTPAPPTSPSSSNPRPATPATTPAMGAVLPTAALSTADLVDPADFEAAGVKDLRIEETYEGGPKYDLSICPGIDGHGDLGERPQAMSRSLWNPDSRVNAYQLLVQLGSTADADRFERYLKGWPGNCGTPAPGEPTQDIRVGATHAEHVPYSERALWWDTTFVSEGTKLMETVAYTRSGTRMTVVVFTGTLAAIKNTDMTTLVTHLSRRMG